MTTWTTTANVTEWTSVEDPRVVFRFVAAATIEGGGGFDGVHNDLDGRSTAEAHPIPAITGLEDALAALGGPQAGSVYTMGESFHVADFFETVIAYHFGGEMGVVLPEPYPGDTPSGASEGKWVLVRRAPLVEDDVIVTAADEGESTVPFDTGEEQVTLTADVPWALFVYGNGGWHTFLPGSSEGGGGTTVARVIEAPSDNNDDDLDGTITTLTATDGVLAVDVVNVGDPVEENDRAAIVTPALSLWPNQFLTIVGQERGPSFGYPIGAQPAVFGDLAALFSGDSPELNYDASPVTLEFTIDGVQRDVLLDADYANITALLTTIITQLATWTTQENSYVDVVGDRTLQAALVSMTTGASSEVTLSDAGIGDPTRLGELTSTDGVDQWHLGYDNDILGVGGLNGGVNGNHSFFDTDLPGKFLVVFNDGTRLYPQVPHRSEFVTAAVQSGGYVTDESIREVRSFLNALNAGLKAVDESGGGADLSDANPAALGSVAPGVATTASRADHVHPVPSASDITTGTLPVGQVPDLAASKITSGTVDVARLPTVRTAGFAHRPRVGSLGSPPFTFALAATADPKANYLGNVAPLTSGRLFLQPIVLQGGVTYTSVGFLSRTTAASGPTNQWFGIFDKDLNAVRLTVDDTSTAWGANTEKTLALTSTYTPTATADHYLGIMVAASMNVPTLVGNGLPGIIPPQTLLANTGMTSPPSLPFQASNLAIGSFAVYGWVI